MSAVLGPIHHWMYRKIQLQEELIRDILHTTRESNWGSEVDGAELTSYASSETRPLEEIIDLSNIHGWLSSQIDAPERRYAHLVTGLLKEDPTRLEVLAGTAYQFGRKHPVNAGGTAQDAFRAINDLLLDGMPCDRAVQVTDNAEDHVTFLQTEDLHSPYWKEYGGDGDNYYYLRSRVIDGMLEHSGYVLKKLGDGEFEIAKA